MWQGQPGDQSEITQSIISVLIIAILIASAQMVCNTTASIGSVVLQNAGVSKSQASLSPFQYADYYAGNLAMHTGLSLLTYVYTTTMRYDIQSTLYGSLNHLNGLLLSEKLGQIPFGDNVKVTFGFSPDLSTMLRFMSDQYLVVFAPLITIVVGALMLQIPLAASAAVLRFRGDTAGGPGDALPLLRRRKSEEHLQRGASHSHRRVFHLSANDPLHSYMMYWVFNPALNPSSQYIALPTLSTPCR